MVGKESDKLEYLSRVFRGLSVEIQDHVLDTAKSLLEIQDDNSSLLCADESVFCHAESETANYGVNDHAG